MHKISSIMVLILFFGTSIAQAEKYINGVAKNNPPFAYIDEKTGKPTGFDVDSMTWIANNIYFEIEHRPMEWDGILYELVTGEIDMVCSGMAITEEGKTLASFTDPYWDTSNSFITTRASEIRASGILNTKINLGVKKGSASAAEIIQGKKDKKYSFDISQYDSYPLIAQALLRGHIDAAFIDTMQAEDISSKENAIKIIAKHGKVESYAVAFRKDDRSLGRMIEEGYKLLRISPYWQELKVKYMNEK